jgi:hypothetical protein
MAEDADCYPMWESLGMDTKAHDGLLAAVGGMYQETCLSQENRPKSTAYLDNGVMNIHSGRIKEMVDHRTEEGRRLSAPSDSICRRRSCLLPMASLSDSARALTG